MPKEVKNAKQMPKLYVGRHMFPGTVEYHDQRILVDADAMKKMARSFEGKPVYVNHQNVNLDNLHNEADGYVTETFYNPNDGWLWSKFIVTSDAGHAAVAKGWSLSNAHKPSQWGTGGTFHNVSYDRKVVDSEFTHLALVDKPRYEGAKIFTPESFKEYQAAKQKELNNSKDEGTKTVFKMFKNKKEEVTEFDDLNGIDVELANGETVSLQEMINAVSEHKEKEAEAARVAAEAEKNKEVKNNAVDMGMEIPMKTGTMKLGDLCTEYYQLKEMKNAEDAKAKEKEVADKKKKEADDEKKNALDAMEKEQMEELANAHLKATPVIVKVDTTQDKLARGSDRY